MSRGHRELRDWIRSFERSGQTERLTVLGFLAGRDVPREQDEIDAAIRRAQLLLAAGGDPHRELQLYGRAVSALAADLDSPCHRRALHTGLEALTEHARGLRGAEESLRLLLADSDLAWQAYAMSLLAEALAEDADA